MKISSNPSFLTILIISVIFYFNYNPSGYYEFEIYESCLYEIIDQNQ